MKKHKWYNEIVAWASGAEIECRFFEQPTSKSNGFWTEWELMTSTYRFSEDDWWEFRIKHTPQEYEVYNLNGDIKFIRAGQFISYDKIKDYLEYLGKITLTL